jgi:alcohol dehydrogenase (cytochrome c)
MQRRRAMESSAMLATAGDIVFEGSRDRWFRASDAKTGKVLWEVRLDAPPGSFPITYTVNGEQYVAITTGGGGSLDTQMAGLTPEIASPSAGVTLWTFKLPSK